MIFYLSKVYRIVNLKSQFMLFNRKSSFILGSLAAYALYRFNKLPEEEKKKIGKNLKEKGNALFEHLPLKIKSMFRRNTIDRVDTPALLFE
jgi:hypothetical protein